MMTAEKNAFCTAYNSVFFVNLPRRFSFFAALAFPLYGEGPWLPRQCIRMQLQRYCKGWGGGV